MDHENCFDKLTLIAKCNIITLKFSHKIENAKLINGKNPGITE